jgi:hypothetical protein
MRSRPIRLTFKSILNEFLGTAQDNADDCVNKSRTLPGSKNPYSKLTEDKVKEIRELFATGEYTKKQLSDLYGVTPTSISYIISRKQWSHVV